MSGRRVLITGGTRGIGAEIAGRLLDAGMEVFVLARKAASATGGATVVEYDLRNTEELPSLLDRLPPLDVLVNNAGIMHGCKGEAYTEAMRKEILSVNLEAPVLLMQHVGARMAARGEGRIVNVGSLAGQIGHPDVWYGVSKAGLLNATKTFACEYGPSGVIINAVAPGPVETEMLATIPAARKEEIVRRVFARRFARPSEVAEVVRWLAIDAPEYLNGVCIGLSNGAFLGG
jgi:3-oxoacyl-[acyl-carrier protein] reductase